MLVNLVTAVALGLFVFANTGFAKVLDLGGNQMNLFGYISQGASYSLAGDKPDNEEGLNSAIFTAFIEADYYPTDDLKLFGSAKFTSDWIYALKDSDTSWIDKEFDRSSDNQEFDDEYWQMINELHATWSTGNAVIRVGKQVVAWGEMDGNRIMDQINPLDQRRGFADVEFESSIIPIWLAKAEYYPEIDSENILDFGIEMIFNPNADFIPTQQTQFGNEEGSIWTPNMDAVFSPYVDIPGPGPGLVPEMALGMLPPPPMGPPPALLAGLPREKAVMGKQWADISEPDEWDPDGFEYGLRIKTLIGNTMFTVNAFYGLDNLPVTKAVAGVLPTVRRRADGTIVEEPLMEGYYPRQRLLGLTMATDLESLRLSALGGVSPILRVEAVYGYHSAYTKILGPVQTFEEYNDLKWGVGLDWKVKIPVLNSKNSFTVSPQFFHTHVFGFPGSDAILLAPGGTGTEEDNFSGSLMIGTQYLHGKIMPSFFILQDFTNKAYFMRPQIVYSYDDNIQFSVGAVIFSGQEDNKSFDLFDNKDQVFCKLTYKFN